MSATSALAPNCADAVCRTVALAIGGSYPEFPDCCVLGKIAIRKAVLELSASRWPLPHGQSRRAWRARLSNFRCIAALCRPPRAPHWQHRKPQTVSAVSAVDPIGRRCLPNSLTSPRGVGGVRSPPTPHTATATARTYSNTAIISRTCEGLNGSSGLLGAPSTTAIRRAGSSGQE